MGHCSINNNEHNTNNDMINKLINRHKGTMINFKIDAIDREN